MLCISRKPGERIVLALPGGGEVVLTMLDKGWRGEQRLGITAPDGVTIFREELREFFAGGRAVGKPAPEAAQEEAAPPAAPTHEEDDPRRQELGGES